MKTRLEILILILTFGLMACNSTPTNIIKDSGVNDYKLGSSLKSFIKKSENIDYVEILGIGNASTEKYFEIFDSKEKIFSLYYLEEKLVGIMVHSDKYLTNRHVKIGDIGQEVINKGYSVGNVVERDYYNIFQVAETDIVGNRKFIDNLRFCFDKKLGSNGKVGKYAMLMSILIGKEFSLIEKPDNKNYGRFSEQLYTNQTSGIEITFPKGWIEINPKKNFHGSSGTDLFNISNPELNINLRFKIEPIKSNVIDTLDYLKDKAEYWLSIDPWDIINRSYFSYNSSSIEQLKSNSVNFYYCVNEGKSENSLIRYHCHFATVIQDFSLWIDAKYYEKEQFDLIAKVLKDIKLKAHNNAS